MSRRAGGGAGGERGSAARSDGTRARFGRRSGSPSAEVVRELGVFRLLDRLLPATCVAGNEGGGIAALAGWVPGLSAVPPAQRTLAATDARRRPRAPQENQPRPLPSPAGAVSPLPACSEQRGRLTHIPQVGRRLGVALVLVMDALPRGGIVQASGVARPRRRIAKMAALAGPLRSRVRARRARQASGEGDRQASSPHERPADCRAARGSHSPQFPASPGAAGRRAVRWGWRGCAVPVDRRSAEPICFGLQQGLHATKSAAMLATSVSAVRPFSVLGSVRAASGMAGAAQPRGSVGSARES